MASHECNGYPVLVGDWRSYDYGLACNDDDAEGSFETAFRKGRGGVGVVVRRAPCPNQGRIQRASEQTSKQAFRCVYAREQEGSETDQSETGRRREQTGGEC